jgi:hypothetical protein
MIQRIVLVKFKNEYATVIERQKFVQYTRVVLATMKGVRSVTAGLPADERAMSWDLSITITVDSMNDVLALRDCPLHQDYAINQLAPRMASHEAWNFEI